MSWLKKLIGRKDDHETWLLKNPGKGAPKEQPPLVSEEESQRMRESMEAELDAQRDKRNA
jgi:hypothetical protein